LSHDFDCVVKSSNEGRLVENYSAYKMFAEQKVILTAEDELLLDNLQGEHCAGKKFCWDSSNVQ
jgi:hypothetical protein